MTYKFNRKYFTEEQINDYINERDNVVVLSVTSRKTGQTSMAPVWMVYHDSKFYFPGSRAALKRDLVEAGDIVAAVTIVNPSFFPEIKQGNPPYVTVTGRAKLQYPRVFSGYAKVLELYFTKYNYENLSSEEIVKISEEVARESTVGWIIELTPEKNYIREVLEAEAEKERKEQENK